MGKGRRVEFAEGPVAGLPDDLPILSPIETFASRTPSPESGAWVEFGLFVVVDPDAIAGLGNVMRQATAGRSFDTSTQWVVSISDDSDQVPIAGLAIEFPETGVAFRLAFSLDDYKGSLVSAARSKRVFLVDPDVARAMKTEESEVALKQGHSVGIELADVEPVLWALQQRHDIPLPSIPGPFKFRLDPSDPESALKIIEGCVAPRDLRLLTGPGSESLLVLQDPDSEEVARLADLDDLVGQWTVLPDENPDGVNVGRLDCVYKSESVRSWVIAPLPLSVARALGVGSHTIAVSANQLPTQEDQEPLESAVLNEALEKAVLVRVAEGSPALRSLLE